MNQRPLVIFEKTHLPSHFLSLIAMYVYVLLVCLVWEFIPQLISVHYVLSDWNLLQSTNPIVKTVKPSSVIHWCSYFFEDLSASSCPQTDLCNPLTLINSNNNLFNGDYVYVLCSLHVIKRWESVRPQPHLSSMWTIVVWAIYRETFFKLKGTDTLAWSQITSVRKKSEITCAIVICTVMITKLNKSDTSCVK